MKTNTILQGDCIEVMKKLPENSVDAIITDPPYGLEFMGKGWDKGVPGIPFWKEMIRVLKPGGFLLSFGGTRTYHRLACGIEDAGFEIRDCIQWLYGSGFPKSLNIGKQIDKINGKSQEEFMALGKYLRWKRGDIPQNKISKFFPSKTGGLTGCVSNWELGMNVPTKEQWIILKRELELDDKFDYLIEREEAEREITGKDGRGELKEDMFFTQNIEKAKEQGKSIGYGKWDLKDKPATPEAKQWEGWGTALKPANEPIVVARKPLSEKNVALNVLKWGTGGINIDACRVNTKVLDSERRSSNSGTSDDINFGTTKNRPPKFNGERHNPQGRFPANIILDKDAGKMLDEQSGELGSNSLAIRKTFNTGGTGNVYTTSNDNVGNVVSIKGKGGASRFFYCAKASKSERNLGCDDLPKVEKVYNGQSKESSKDMKDVEKRWTTQPKHNNHPTVKPISLMEYLIKLVSREGALVLDPFLGSGTTAIACQKLGRKWIGIEKEEEYVKIAKARIKPFLEQSKLQF